MWSSVKVRFHGCHNCGFKNPVTWTRCGRCHNPIDPKRTIDQERRNERSQVVPRRLSILTQIQNSLNFATHALSLVPNEILSFIDKHRITYLAIEKVVQCCQQCTDLMNLLITIGKDLEVSGEQNLNPEQIDLITGQINQIRDHLESYEQVYYPHENILEIQRTVRRLNIHQNIPHYHVDHDDNENENEYDDDDVQYGIMPDEDIEDWEILPDNWEDDLVRPANPSEINLLQLVDQETVPKGEENSCIVCLEPYEYNALPVTILPCGHMFHDVCIRSWLNRCHTCPLGRCRLRKPEEIIAEKLAEKIEK